MCNHDPSDGSNVMNCSGTSLTSLPESIPENTNVLDLRNNTITELCTIFPYMQNLTLLDVESNDIEKMCVDFVVSMEIISHKGLIISARDNALAKLPQEIALSLKQYSGHFQEIHFLVTVTCYG